MGLDPVRVAVVGGGAAGCLGAITAARAGARVTLFEAASRPLRKVRISGGGRCNVTARCLDPREFVRHYPRGGKELLGPMTRFGARQTWDWFAARGVPLVVEADGRVFPASGRSETITDCLEREAAQAGVTLHTRAAVRGIGKRPDGTLEVDAAFDGDAPNARAYDRVLLTTGSAPDGYALARSLGHTIVPPVPSLFTFDVHDPRITGLAGVSVSASHLALTTAGGRSFEYPGPLLITHWGLSGPAVLRLSAWAARHLAECDYRAELTVNWLPDDRPDDLAGWLRRRRHRRGGRRIAGDHPEALPARLWSRLTEAAGVSPTETWADLTREEERRLVGQLTAAVFVVSGRGRFKEEFVTAGGVERKEVDFRTMESRVCPGLYLAGEILDIDGITGGYNLQSAWTCGRIAGEAMAS